MTALGKFIIILFVICLFAATVLGVVMAARVVVDVIIEFYDLFREWGRKK